MPYGERAERVVTSFGRGFIPLIRYRTNDLVVKVPHTSCGCGRTGDIYQGGIQGRWDDMKLVRGTNVYPRAVESIVRECAAVDEFQILLTREGCHRRDQRAVELKPGREDHWDALSRRLQVDLADAHEGLRFKVEQAAAELAAALRAEGQAARGQAAGCRLFVTYGGKLNERHDLGEGCCSAVR